jgi:hypothetical protein
MSAWLVVVLVFIAMIVLLSILGRAPQRMPVVMLSVLALGLGVGGYEIWQFNWLQGLTILFVMAIDFGLAVQFGSNRDLQARVGKKPGEYEKAEYGVPHCDFNRTSPDGFTVMFKRMPLALVEGNPVGLNFILSTLFILFSKGTRIEVTKDDVVIDDKRFKRAEFGGFRICSGPIT